MLTPILFLQKGSFVIHIAGLDGCDFTNLPLSIAVCNMIMPLLGIPLAYLLLPNLNLSDPIGNDSQKEKLVETEKWDNAFNITSEEEEDESTV